MERRTGYASFSPQGAGLLPAHLDAGPAHHPAKSHHHVPGLCGHLYGGPAGPAGAVRRHRRQHPHLSGADHHLRPPQRPLRAGEPVLGQARYGGHQPLYGYCALHGRVSGGPHRPGAVSGAPPGHGAGDGQRPSDPAGSPLSPDRGHQLRLQHRQLRLRGGAAQHGKPRHGPHRVHHLHGAEYIFELCPDLRKVRRACSGRCRRRYPLWGTF